MGRSLKKGPFVDEKLYRKVERLSESGGRKPIRTWARACTIVPEFVGHTFQVHNGRAFTDVFVTEDMVGHRLTQETRAPVLRLRTGTLRRRDCVAQMAGASPEPRRLLERDGVYPTVPRKLHP